MISLSGKQLYNPLNLTGKPLYNNSAASTPHYITKIKRIIFDRFITPILGKNWKMLKENLFQINDITHKVEIYYENTKDESLLVYKYMLQVIKNTIDTAEELTTLEEKLFDNGKDIAKIMFKVPRIRLKPEMEIYNLIIGKPDKNIYDKNILAYIAEIIQSSEYIPFNAIEEKIKRKYNFI